MKTLAEPVAERFGLYDVDWAFYDSLLRRLGDRHVFVTYDRGRLELMSPSPEHEGSSALIGRLIGTLTLELNLPIRSGRSTTFRRKDLDRGLEPDECYWIQNEARIRGRKRIDLTRDPPPDLAIEVEISHRLLDREAIYAALGVPELWRYDGARLRVFLLGEDGVYHASKRSRCLPMAPRSEMERVLEMRDSAEENSLVRGFQDWVRTHLAGRARG